MARFLEGRSEEPRAAKRRNSAMADAKLFSPMRFGALELANRIVIAPMCQYSAEDGCMTDWHLIHLGHLALSGAGLLTIEATAVSPEGRITYADVGLYSDGCEAAMGRVLESLRRWSDMPLAIQLSHAGRKASTDVPWLGGAQMVGGVLGWQTVAPSAIPFQVGQNAPSGSNLTIESTTGFLIGLSRATLGHAPWCHHRPHRRRSPPPGRDRR